VRALTGWTSDRYHEGLAATAVAVNELVKVHLAFIDYTRRRLMGAAVSTASQEARDALRTVFTQARNQLLTSTA